MEIGKHNKKVVLILGDSGTGKTFSTKRLINEHGDSIAYIDTDGHNALPFKGKNKIKKWIIPKDPLDVLAGVRALETDQEIKIVIIDTLSHWLRKLEQKYVINSDDSRGAWGKVYQQSIFDLLDFATNQSDKTWIFLSHTYEGELKANQIPIKAFVKGSTKAVGIESFFQFVIYTDVVDDDTSPRGIRERFQLQKTLETKNLSVKTPEDFYPEPYTQTNDIMQILELIDAYDDEE